MTSQPIDLKALERRAYLSYHEDGVLDIFIGLGALFFGLFMLTDMFWMAGVFPAIFTPVYVSAKRSITIPRIGYVKFGPQRARTPMLAILGIGIALFLCFLVGLVGFAGYDIIPPAFFAWLRAYHMLVLGAIVAVALGGTALITGLRRLYAYAALTVLLFAGGYLLGAPAWLQVLALGGLILCSGVALLIRFLRRYPIAAESTEVDS